MAAAAPCGDSENQKIHIVSTELPVGAVKAQDPGRAGADQAHDQGNHPVVVKLHMLEEPLQTAIGRHNRSAIELLCRDMRQIDRACADDADNQKAEGFLARLAKADMGR